MQNRTRSKQPQRQHTEIPFRDLAIAPSLGVDHKAISGRSEPGAIYKNAVPK
jgi:hypothetical protein